MFVPDDEQGCFIYDCIYFKIDRHVILVHICHIEENSFFWEASGWKRGGGGGVELGWDAKIGGV